MMVKRGEGEKRLFLLCDLQTEESVAFMSDRRKKKKKAFAMHFASPRLCVTEGHMKQNKTKMTYLIEFKL